MRIVRAITDLPWWSGLPIFLVGNLIIPIPYVGFIIGILVCLFGCWIFSKLLKYDEYADSARAIIFIPLMILSLWFINEDFIAWSFGTLYTLRLVTGLFFGLIAFQGFVK